MAEICAPASAKQIVAVFVNGVLLLAARGMTPTPCHRVRFERSPIDVEPPHFRLRACMDEGIICAQVIAPYEIVDIFRIGSRRTHVIVHDAAGEHRVPVYVIGDRGAFAKDGASALVEGAGTAEEAGSAAAAEGERVPAGFGGGEDVPWPFEGKALRTGALFAKRLETVATSPRRATGYSGVFSFDEAFKDAMANLPPDPQPFPDKLTTTRVTAVGAHIGGFPGLHRMFVSIIAF